MGEGWEAEDTVLGRHGAVKIVDLPRTDDPRRDEIRARAMREGRAAAQIDDPHSVRVYDVVDEDDLLYLVMELVRATSLDTAVAQDGPMAPADAARLGLDVLAALTAAHRAGVVHRDVKPGNVMVLPDGRVKLADFGIASVTEDPDLTAAGLVLGTPKYVSPEAAIGQRAGFPADLWGLGALLYFAVEGEAPFDRDGTIPTLHAVIHDEPRRMTRAGALGPVIDALLRKDPTQRPSEDETRRLLERARTEDATALAPTSVVAAPRPTIVAPAAAPPTSAPAPPRAAPRRDRRGAVLRVALAALLLLGGLGLVLARQRDDTPSTTASTTTTAAPATTTTTVASTTTSTTAATTTTA